MPIQTNSTVVAVPDHLSCDLAGEAAILNMKNSVYYGLNTVGARIGNLIQHPVNVEQVRDTLVNEYNVEPGRCESDLLALLEELHREGLIKVQ